MWPDRTRRLEYTEIRGKMAPEPQLNNFSSVSQLCRSLVAIMDKKCSSLTLNFWLHSFQPQEISLEVETKQKKEDFNDHEARCGGRAEKWRRNRMTHSIFCNLLWNRSRTDSSSSSSDSVSELVRGQQLGSSSSSSLSVSSSTSSAVSSSLQSVAAVGGVTFNTHGEPSLLCGLCDGIIWTSLLSFSSSEDDVLGAMGDSTNLGRFTTLISCSLRRFWLLRAAIHQPVRQGSHGLYGPWWLTYVHIVQA